MLYLDRNQVNMTAIGEANYQDHGWNETKAPEKATSGFGEESVARVIEHLRVTINQFTKAEPEPAGR